MFYLWAEEILGDCDEVDFKESIEALLDATAHEEDKSSSEGESGRSPPQFAQDLEDSNLGPEVGSMLKAFQKEQEASRGRSKRDLGMPSIEETLEQQEAAAAASRGSALSSNSTAGARSQGLGPELSSSSMALAHKAMDEQSESETTMSERPLSAAREEAADLVFEAGAHDGTGSVDAATLFRAVKACGDAPEWQACRISLEQVGDETFGLCQADFHVWMAEVFSQVDDEVFTEKAAQLAEALKEQGNVNREAARIEAAAQAEAKGKEGEAAPEEESNMESEDIPRPDPENCSDEDLKYLRMLREAETTDFTAMMRMGFLHVVRDEALGQPVVVILARNIDLEDVEFSLAVKFFMWMLDTIADTKYALIYLNANASMDNLPPIAWMSKAKHVLPRKYRKNLTALYVVEPSMMLKTTMGLITPFISRKFWKKLTFVDSISELFHQDSKVGYCCHLLLEMPSVTPERPAPMWGTTPRKLQ